MMAILNPLYIALGWFERQTRMQDWEVKLCIQDDIPDWVEDVQGKTAAVSISLSYKTAEIWISEERCKNEEIPPTTVLFHELLHIILLDAGLSSETCNLARVEFFLNRLECVFADLYDRQMDKGK